MIDISTLVNDKNEIFISESYWKELNKNFSKDKIKQSISNAIECFNVPLPYRKITKEDCYDDFNNLINLKTTELFNTSDNIVTRYDYKFEMSKWYIDLCNTGNKSSDYFHQEARWKADSINAPSPYRTWTTEKFRLTLLNALWTLKFTEINSNTLRTAIGLRKYIAGQFRPSAAKAIYDLFDKRLVLDPSAGWGDRLSAFYAYGWSKRKQGTLYEACDPNTNIDYFKQMSSLKLPDAYMYSSIEHVPFEEKHFTLSGYDLVFTSPPYFNIEKYSNEETQSYKKYKGYDKWIEWFLHSYIKSAWDRTNSNGYFVINISDVYSGHKINKICDPMNEYLESLGGSYEGTIGYRMPKRPNSKACQDGIFVEPMWVWKNVSTSTPTRDSKKELDDKIVKFLTKEL